jgi:hypothetical protein
MFLVKPYIGMPRRGQAAMDARASAIHGWSPATFVIGRSQLARAKVRVEVSADGVIDIGRTAALRTVPVFERYGVMSTRYSIGVDIGGTFTDVVLISENGQVRSAKGLSTPSAFDRGIADILQELLVRESFDLTDCELVSGTTVATNAIIERNGARTGLITTKGFRDVLELRRIRIPASRSDLAKA